MIQTAEFRNEPVHRFTDEHERKGFAAAIERVSGQLDASYPLVIGGYPVETETRITSVNPAHPDQCIGITAASDEVNLEKAVEAAKTALPDWAGRGFVERANTLRKVAKLLREQRDEFAAWEIFEAGKPWSEADADVCEAIDYLNYYAQMAELIGAGQNFDAAGESNRYEFLPRGMVAVIPPWNFPLAILVGMLSASIVCGNTVILKPSSQTPVIAARFVSLLHQADVPAGVVNYLPGLGSQIGDQLVQHPDVHLVAFTGSCEVGLRIRHLASRPSEGQRHVRRVIAEMGGEERDHC